jgi:basic membrane lipoprotein Med (substrate-binding protein (PBP1-ABC) superfamily)
MNAAFRFSLAALALSMLAACGGGTSTPADEAAEDAAAEELGRDTDKTVVDDMIQTQDRARAVEGVTLGHKQDLDQALEASEGDTADAEEE